MPLLRFFPLLIEFGRLPLDVLVLGRQLDYLGYLVDCREFTTGTGVRLPIPAGVLCAAGGYAWVWVIDVRCSTVQGSPLALPSTTIEGSSRLLCQFPFLLELYILPVDTLVCGTVLKYEKS